MISHCVPFELTAFLLTSAAFSAKPAFAASCGGLADLNLPNTTISMAQPESAGTFAPPGSAARADLCRLHFAASRQHQANLQFRHQIRGLVAASGLDWAV